MLLEHQPRIEIWQVVEEEKQVAVNLRMVRLETRCVSQPVVLTDDGLVPNEAGYNVMAPLAAKAIAEALGRK